MTSLSTDRKPNTRYNSIIMPKKFVRVKGGKFLHHSKVRGAHKKYSDDGLEIIYKTAERFNNSELQTDRISFSAVGHIPLETQPKFDVTQDIQDYKGNVISGLKDHISFIPLSIEGKTSGQPDEKDLSKQVRIFHDIDALRKMSAHVRKHKLFGEDASLVSDVIGNATPKISSMLLGVENLYDMMDRVIEHCDPKKDKKYIACVGIVGEILQPLIAAAGLVAFHDFSNVLDLDKTETLHVHDNDAVGRLFQNKQFYKNKDVYCSYEGEPHATTYVDETDAIFTNAHHKFIQEAGREILKSLIPFDIALREGMKSIQAIRTLQRYDILEDDKADPKKKAEAKKELHDILAVTANDFTTDKKLHLLDEINDMLYTLGHRHMKQYRIIPGRSEPLLTRVLHGNQSSIVFEPTTHEGGSWKSTAK